MYLVKVVDCHGEEHTFPQSGGFATSPEGELVVRDDSTSDRARAAFAPGAWHLVAIQPEE